MQRKNPIRSVTELCSIFLKNATSNSACHWCHLKLAAPADAGYLSSIQLPFPDEGNHRWIIRATSALTAAVDRRVLSSRTWRLADLGANKSMLLAGLGWGNMPAHTVAVEIKDGRLTVIRPAGFDLVLGAAHISERRLGPAGQWMLNRLTSAERGAI